MKNYTYKNELIGKKQLRQLLAWSFTNYDSMQACSLADELKYLGFKYASQAGISISIEDLKVPFVKSLILEEANQEIVDAEKVYLKGKITDVERFQKIIDTWSLTSESLKTQIIYYFKNYDPLNSVYIMAFSGARGNLSQVRQLVGMRGLMSDPSGEILNLPIKKNFREGLTITDYLMSGYGARKGIVDTALKTANSGYLTRRLIDVAQEILIRDDDCFTTRSFQVSSNLFKSEDQLSETILGRILSKPVIDLETNAVIATSDMQITPKLIQTFCQRKISKVYVRSPLTCALYRGICQKCYGWDLATENLIDIGVAIGILAGQSIGEPGTQLTMRTFHTGGIFTSEARQQIISPSNGIIQFYKLLKTVVLRTNRGEDVLVTKNSGSLILIPDQKDQPLVQIDVQRNTILFPKNNQYILRDTVIGEVINTSKQIKTEIKPILADTAGEVFIPKVKQKVNVINNNKLLWILSGALYNTPKQSFVNFYPDYKINRSSYIFRTKIVNPMTGFVEFVNDKKGLSERNITVTKHQTSWPSASLQLLDSNSSKFLNRRYNALLTLNSRKYFVTIHSKKAHNFLQFTRAETFGMMVTRAFDTLTGGTMYYHYPKWKTSLEGISKVSYVRFNKSFLSTSYPLAVWASIMPHHMLLGPRTFYEEPRYPKAVSCRTIVWLAEEVHKVECETKALFVEPGDFISEGFELIPDVFSKTSGVVGVKQKNKSITNSISIKLGMVYEGKEFSSVTNKVYYPGEVICSNILIKTPSLCESVHGKESEQLLIRPIELYEFPYIRPTNLDTESLFSPQSNSSHSYKSNQTLNSVKGVSLVSKFGTFNTTRSLYENLQVSLVVNPNKPGLDVKFTEQLLLNSYLAAQLKYTNLESCALVQNDQFVSNYTTLGYFEAVTPTPVEIVKVKVKKQETKQILLVSNEHCSLIPKTQLPNKKLNDFVLDTDIFNQTGQIIIENKNYFTVQKGRPYFFPNCNTDGDQIDTTLDYKFLPSKRFQTTFQTKRAVSVTRYHEFGRRNSVSKRLYIKKNRKLYSYPRPWLQEKITIGKQSSNRTLNPLVRSGKKYISKPQAITNLLEQFLPMSGNPTINVFVQSSEMVNNNLKNGEPNNYQLSLLSFADHPMSSFRRIIKKFKLKRLKHMAYDYIWYLDGRITKERIGGILKKEWYAALASGDPDRFKKIEKIINHLARHAYISGLDARGRSIYALSNDYTEQEVNSVFCTHNEFIDAGKTIGLLSLEKEITGDIVQGLPRIEEILEARKKFSVNTNLPFSQLKGALIQKPALDLNFEFRNLGTTVKENDKVNPHKLLHVYFTYYGSYRRNNDYDPNSVNRRTKLRLFNNYEGTYNSFKKVQTFILNSVQAVYKSQGVNINNKHLEVIINQMTTKVLVTSVAGNRNLVPSEVIDFYHAVQINETMLRYDKTAIYYIPVLFGITKAALNSPSFISAASFQETTRVLTKAAIEGRRDHLIGLKENIIIGRLLPAGTGFSNSQRKNSIVSTVENIRNVEQTPRQVF